VIFLFNIHYEINHYNSTYGSHHPNHIFYIIRELSIANKNFSVPNYTYVLHVAACLSQCESAPIHKSCTFCCTLGTNNILRITFFCSPFKITYRQYVAVYSPFTHDCRINQYQKKCDFHSNHIIGMIRTT